MLLTGVVPLLAPVLQNKTLKALEEAMRLSDPAALTEAIEAAKKAGVGEDPLVAAAAKLVVHLQEERVLVEQLSQVLHPCRAAPRRSCQVSRVSASEW